MVWGLGGGGVELLKSWAAMGGFLRHYPLTKTAMYEWAAIGNL